MPEKVLFESESSQTRAEIAAYLRTVAETLDDGGEITLQSGSESVTLDPPADATFEVKAEREGTAGGPGELSVEFELEWNENGDSGGSEDGHLEIN
jgi:amphi-Trp domain-containing protein